MYIYVCVCVCMYACISLKIWPCSLWVQTLSIWVFTYWSKQSFITEILSLLHKLLKYQNSTLQVMG